MYRAVPVRTADGEFRPGKLAVNLAEPALSIAVARRRNTSGDLVHKPLLLELVQLVGVVGHVEDRAACQLPLLGDDLNGQADGG